MHRLLLHCRTWLGQRKGSFLFYSRKRSSTSYAWHRERQIYTLCLTKREAEMISVVLPHSTHNRTKVSELKTVAVTSEIAATFVILPSPMHLPLLAFHEVFLAVTAIWEIVGFLSRKSYIVPFEDYCERLIEQKKLRNVSKIYMFFWTKLWWTLTPILHRWFRTTVVSSILRHI